MLIETDKGCTNDLSNAEVKDYLCSPLHVWQFPYI